MAASYRISARAAALAVLVVAIGCAIAAVLLARRLWWPKRADASDLADDADLRSPLERALEVAVLRADTGDLPERRRALERVARELGAAGDPALAGEVRALAWAPTAPTTAQIESLIDRAGIPAVVGETS